MLIHFSQKALFAASSKKVKWGQYGTFTLAYADLDTHIVSGLGLAQLVGIIGEAGKRIGTSDKGLSEIGTTSLQRTLVATPC